MTSYRIKTFDKKNPINFEVHSLSEALVQFAYDYEEALKKVDLTKTDFILEIKWKSNGKSTGE